MTYQPSFFGVYLFGVPTFEVITVATAIEADLSGSVIAPLLDLSGSSFATGIDLSGSTIAGFVDLAGTTFQPICRSRNSRWSRDGSPPPGSSRWSSPRRAGMSATRGDCR